VVRRVGIIKFPGIRRSRQKEGPMNQAAATAERTVGGTCEETVS
jgi:hypothetical protein